MGFESFTTQNTKQESEHELNLNHPEAVRLQKALANFDDKVFAEKRTGLVQHFMRTNPELATAIADEIPDLKAAIEAQEETTKKENETAMQEVEINKQSQDHVASRPTEERKETNASETQSSIEDAHERSLQVAQEIRSSFNGYLGETQNRSEKQYSSLLSVETCRTINNALMRLENALHTNNTEDLNESLETIQRALETYGNETRHNISDSYDSLRKLAFYTDKMRNDFSVMGKYYTSMESEDAQMVVSNITKITSLLEKIDVFHNKLASIIKDHGE